MNAPAGRLVPLAVLALAAMCVPTNLGGWGPREGVAAWSFAAAGLGADQGLAAATAYGVLALASTLPGLAVLAWAPVTASLAGGSCPVGGRDRWLSGRTPCSVARCRSTATWTVAREARCGCPVPRTSTGWTPCGRAATPSWSVRPPSAPTTRGCWSAHRTADAPGWPAASRRRPSRSPSPRAAGWRRTLTSSPPVTGRSSCTARAGRCRRPAAGSVPSPRCSTPAGRPS